MPDTTSGTTATPGDTPIKTPTATTHEATTPAPATTTSITGNWNEQKTKLKAKFPSLTESDLHYDNGKKEEMFTRIQEKLGKTKDELTIIVSGL